ncbi:hypothetical protein Hanom_Chr11g00992361 [Helianthus anomalus]
MNQFKRKALKQDVYVDCDVISDRFIVDLLSIEEIKDVKEMFKKIYIDDDSIVIVEGLFI